MVPPKIIQNPWDKSTALAFSLQDLVIKRGSRLQAIRPEFFFRSCGSFGVFWVHDGCDRPVIDVVIRE
jgi:hypothetical protein